MSDAIFSIFGAFAADTVIGIIFVGLLLLAVFGWLGILARQTVPGLMTSLGIFGTFWGVFIALYPLDFSPGKMNASIESLLGGMTTAFTTSLLGLAFAIVAKAVWSRAKEEKNSPEARLAERLDAIKQAIAGGSDSDMITQLRDLRDANEREFSQIRRINETIRDNSAENLTALRELRDASQAGFAQIENLTETIRGALVDNLNALIENIREVLFERFGNNLEALNASMLALNEWQQQHRAQVEQLTNAFDLAAQQIAEIRQECEAIPQQMNALANVVGLVQGAVDAVNQGAQAMHDNLQALADVRVNAQQVLPELQNTMQQIGEQFAIRVNEELDRIVEQWGNNMVAIAQQCADAINAVDQQDGN